VNPDQLDEELRRLSLDEAHDDRPSVPGQRISEYEKALTPQAAKQELGFQVIKRSEPRSDGIHLDNFPNGMFDHIMRRIRDNSILTCTDRDSDAHIFAFAA
jgi:hypothetical protein